MSLDETVTQGWLDGVLGIPSWVPIDARNSWDSRRSVYNFKGNNTRRLRSGHAKALRGQRVHELVIGDSLTAACTSQTPSVTFDRPNAWPYVYARGLDLPVGGSGWMRMSDYNYQDSRYAYVGSWTNNTTNVYSSSAGATCTFTADRAGSGLSLLYAAGSGAFTISIDGATSGNNFLSVAASGGSGNAIATLPNASIRVGSKIVLTSATASINVFVAMSIFNASGIVVNNVAQSGSQVAGSGQTSWSDTVGAGAGAGNQPVNIYAAATSYESAPTVVHIMLGSNDMQVPTPVATIMSAITNLINLVKSAFPGIDVILHLAPQPNVVSVANWMPFAAAMYALADTLDVPLIDHWDALGGYAIEQANGITGDTLAHFTSAGYAQMGRTVSAALSGAGDLTPVPGGPLVRIDGTGVNPSPSTWTWQRTTPTASITQPLPTGAKDGDVYRLEHTGTNFVLSYQRAGSDTIEGSTAAFGLNPGDRVTLTYHAFTAQWTQEREVSSPTAGTAARRDPNARIQVNAPAGLADAMNKGFQDSKALTVITANVTSSATASTETILLQAAVPANSIYLAQTAGRPVKLRLFGYSTSTGTLTFRVRVGAAGTTADAVAWVSTTTAAQAANQRASLDVELVLPVVGSSGTIIAEGEGTAGTATVGTAVAAPSTVSVNTTALWYIEVTVVCTVASGFIARMGSIVVN